MELRPADDWLTGCGAPGAAPVRCGGVVGAVRSARRCLARPPPARLMLVAVGVPNGAKNTVLLLRTNFMAQVLAGVQTHYTPKCLIIVPLLLKV